MRAEPFGEGVNAVGGEQRQIIRGGKHVIHVHQRYPMIGRRHSSEPILEHLIGRLATGVRVAGGAV